MYIRARDIYIVSGKDSQMSNASHSTAYAEESFTAHNLGAHDLAHIRNVIAAQDQLIRKLSAENRVLWDLLLSDAEK
jgi:hypothetical protein